ncbi:hypothetical protein K3495_g4879 [Podosphaera aphanis]|nr:hypothetical protein K3495_g4879 [Podosphaera aphanis]
MVSSRQSDGFFVEDCTLPSRSTHDYIKRIGRLRQEALANELSRQASETYMDDIARHMYHMEELTLADVASIDIQQEIQWFMRPYLIDFLIEAHGAFQLRPETLFLAINLLDRYCSRRVVYKRHYQLVGCAALLIAAKYGDRKERVPMIKELKSMCCSLYDDDMFTQMEWHVLNTLEWSIGHPTVDSFLQLAVQTGSSVEDIELEHMALYLCELASYHKEFVSRKPSVLAAASLALSRGILGRPEVMEAHTHEVEQVMIDLSLKIDHPSQVLYRKYASSQMSRVSSTVENFLHEQEAAKRRAITPAPLLVAPTCDKSILDGEIYPGTPHKQPNNGIMVNGYMTPPITPDGDNFSGSSEAREATSSRCPITPTPSFNASYISHQQYQQYHDTRFLICINYLEK